MLKESSMLLFNSYYLKIAESQIHSFFKTSTFSPIKRNEPDLWTKLKVNENILHISTFVDSYLAADLAEFIRQELLQNEISFTYETVMSHESKLAFLQQAKNKGFRVFVYYVATEDPEINISRVNVRVAQDGHYVSPEVVRDRYYRSLKQLKAAIKLSNRAYLWDNSGQAGILIAEITDGIDVNFFDTNKVSNWFVKYLLMG